MALGRATNDVIIGGILIHLSLGTLFVWGCIQPYVTSYIRLYDASVTTHDTIMVYVWGCLGHALVAPLVGPVQSRLGFRGCAMAGVALVALSTLACSRAKSVAELFVLYFIFGVGTALAYTCPLVCGYAWMPNRMGVVSGFVLAGFGASPAVFDGLVTAVVNPDNASPDPTTGYYGKEIADRVPLMFVVLSSCCLVLGMIGSSMMSLPPLESLAQGTAGVYSKLVSGVGSDSYKSVSTGGSTSSDLEERADRGESVQAGAVAQGGHIGHNDLAARTVASVIPLPPAPRELQGSKRLQEQAHADIGGPTKSAIALGNDGCARSQGGAHVKGSGGGEVIPQRQFEVWDLSGERDYYHLVLCMVLTSVSGLYIAGSYKRIGQESFTNGDRFLSILGAFASLFNAAGRIVGGLLVDRFGCFPTLVVMAVTMTCALLSLSLTEATRPSFFVTVCFVHMLYGFNFAIYPTLTADFFGATTAGPNCGLVIMGYGIFSFVGMLGLTRINKSNQAFLACAGISFVGATSAALLWSRRWRRGLLTRQHQ